MTVIFVPFSSILYNGSMKEVVSMRQIVQMNDNMKKEVVQVEQTCEMLIAEMLRHYKQHEHLVIEFIRCKKGKEAQHDQCLESDYQSFIEVGLEEEDEYFPHGYIPVWKCKQEEFQKIGYITDDTYEIIKNKLSNMIEETIAE
ncbi:hypothetical protein MHI57_05315 [Cytobacillus sp. FSL K6-0129]|uniref:hypothetical protein n=2 Tax=Bacillaceae TaxID=186817 RepID=UPI0030F9744B